MQKKDTSKDNDDNDNDDDDDGVEVVVESRVENRRGKMTSATIVMGRRRDEMRNDDGNDDDGEEIQEGGCGWRVRMCNK
jgi:hypothetical protein